MSQPIDPNETGKLTQIFTRPAMPAPQEPVVAEPAPKEWKPGWESRWKRIVAIGTLITASVAIISTIGGGVASGFVFSVNWLIERHDAPLEARTFVMLEKIETGICMDENRLPNGNRDPAQLAQGGMCIGDSITARVARQITLHEGGQP